MRKLSVLTLLCISFITQSLKAQYYFYDDKYYENAVVYEFGLSAGVMNSLTDLGGKKGIGKNFIKDLRWKTAKPSYGGYFLANYIDKLSLRIEATFGEVVAFDSILKSVAHTTSGRYERNLSFKSKISEIQLGLEVHPFSFLNYEEREPPRITPYGIIGVGYYSFNPQAQLNGQWYSLQPLSLEGQGFEEYPERKTYKLQQFNFSNGLGLKYDISPLLNARLEFVQRVLFTDYLDDASTGYIEPGLFYKYLPANKAAIAQQLYDRKKEITPGDGSKPYDQRGDPGDRDSYFTIQLKIGIILGRQLK
jgi:hypothetical protein